MVPQATKAGVPVARSHDTRAASESAGGATARRRINARPAAPRAAPAPPCAGVLTETTAELALALTFAAARRVVEGDEFMRAGACVGWCCGCRPPGRLQPAAVRALCGLLADQPSSPLLGAAAAARSCCLPTRRLHPCSAGRCKGWLRTLFVSSPCRPSSALPTRLHPCPAGRYKGWLPTLFVGNLLQNKTVGIVGAGRIGTAYARMMVRPALGTARDALLLHCLGSRRDALLLRWAGELAALGPPPAGCGCRRQEGAGCRRRQLPDASATAVAALNTLAASRCAGGRPQVRPGLLLQRCAENEWPPLALQVEGHKCDLVYYDPYPNAFLEQYVR